MIKITSQLKYQIAIILTLCIYLYYLIYRLCYTINPHSLLLSISFYYAEVHGFIALFLFFFQIWNPTSRKAPPPPPGLLVDVYIPTYNEDITILRKTVLGCMNMRYPHKTYILDDGNRPELAKASVKWGCEYIARCERSNAKAGNLNHALQLTQGEFIAIFDADFVPQSDFLEKTLGYFGDQKVAFIQTPHNYYNVDSFQFRIKKEKEKSWNEQDIFYRLMMPCRDYWNSTFFAGTAAVFWKKALDDIGGFATGTITEDLHTTMLLYKRGWKGIYHNEILSNGLAAKDLKNYHIQKLRWAEGNISLLFNNNPLFTRGLSFSQRICFFAIIFGWLIGFPKLIYFITPPIMILTGSYPIAPFDISFIWRYVMFLAVIIFGFKFACRGYGRVRYDECYNMMNFFILIKAAFRNLFRLKSSFVVTKKGLQEAIGMYDIIPQALLCLICFAGVVWGGFKLSYGISADFLGIGTAIFWSIINGFLALFVMESVTRPHYRRKDFRFIGGFPVQFSIRIDPEFATSAVTGKVVIRRDSGGEWFGSVIGLGVGKDINEHGISLITFTPLPFDKKVSLSLYLDQKVLQCKATILYMQHSNTLHGKMFVYGAKFEGLSEHDIDLINMYCFNTILPRFRYQFSKKPSLFLTMSSKFLKRVQFRRDIRKKITLPLIINATGYSPLTVVTNDISIAGLSFISYFLLESGVILDMEIFTPFGTLDTKGIVKHVREIMTGHSYFVQVKFIQSPECSEDILSNITGKKLKQNHIQRETDAKV